MSHGRQNWRVMGKVPLLALLPEVSHVPSAHLEFAASYFRGWGGRNLPRAERKNQKSGDSINDHHIPALICKATLAVGTIMVN